MFNTRGWIALGLLSAFALPAMAQSFRVQCPTNTVTHPNPANNNLEPAYSGPTYPTPATPPTNPTDYTTGKTGPVNGRHQCQQISGGDGYATMGDGTQTYCSRSDLCRGSGTSGRAYLVRNTPTSSIPRIRCRPATPWCPVIRPRPWTV